MILDPSTGLCLANSLQYGAILLPRASQTATVPKNLPTSTVFSETRFFGSYDNKFLEVFFLVEPILREAWPALFEILHTNILHSPVPNDWNDLVLEIHERMC